MHAALALALSLAAPDFVSPLSETQRAQGHALVAAMRVSPRGPYGGVLWYCNDGSEQPPRLNGCAEHGGGAMYGVFSAEAQKLFRLGIYGGTILTALTIDDLTTTDFYRARALVIERYLERAQNGWVLEQAKTFRGFRQDEDEAESARRLLIELAGERQMVERSRAVLIRLSRALPYGRGAEALAYDIRGMAAVIGDADPAFASLRFKIHALPEPSDLEGVTAYAAGRDDELGEKARALADAMRRYYDPASRLERLRAVKQWLAVKPVRDRIQAFIDTEPSDTLAVIEAGAALVEAAGVGLYASDDPKAAERNLLRLHTIGIVEELWTGLTVELARRTLSRRTALATMAKLVRAAQLAGLLSQRERDTAQAALDRMQGAEAVEYAQDARTLGRVLEWSRARLGLELGVPLARYVAVEPASALVIDDMLRSGVMLPLAALYDRIAADADAALGGGHELLGLDAAAAGLRGENPGIAIGPLQVLEPGADPHTLERGAVALLRELPPDLPPVAGVLSVGAPGSLSHVALLARNLGIPLAAVGAELADALAAHRGERFVLGVSAGRRVLLGLSRALGEDVVPTAARPRSALRLDAAKLDLTSDAVLALSEVSEADAGVRAGPKAAVLGRLRRLFPTRVADGAVIPFAAFVRHVDEGEAPTPLALLREAYARHASTRQEPGEGTAEADLFAALARFRESILTRPFPAGFEADVKRALKRLGQPGSFGVFVRSDTNVEDLADFTGAGLNLTVPNRVAVRDILQAIREVWASPFSERSFRWRQQLLANPEHVYPSVVLHRTVPSEVSGVMVTTDLDGTSPGALTVSAGEGVAAVVDGGSPETLVLEPGGGVRLLASSRSPTRKLVPRPPGKGVYVVAAQGKDPLLGDRELAELRRLAEEIRERIPAHPDGLPWDIEFGLVRGKAFLMQIRPLKISRAASAHPLLTALDAAASAPATTVVLDEGLP